MLKVIMAAERKRLINRKEHVAEFEKSRVAFAGGKLALSRSVGMYVC